MIIKFDVNEAKTVLAKIDYFREELFYYRTDCKNEIEKFADKWTDFRGNNFRSVYNEYYDRFLDTNIKAVESMSKYLSTAEEKYVETESNAIEKFKLI